MSFVMNLICSALLALHARLVLNATLYTGRDVRVTRNSWLLRLYDIRGHLAQCVRVLCVWLSIMFGWCLFMKYVVYGTRYVHIVFIIHSLPRVVLWWYTRAACAFSPRVQETQVGLMYVFVCYSWTAGGGHHCTFTKVGNSRFAVPTTQGGGYWNGTRSLRPYFPGITLLYCHRT